MHKLSHQSAGAWVAHSHAPVFASETTSAKRQRLIAGVPGGDVVPLQRLIECLDPPFIVLYVLHTPRGEGAPGRYQSPELELGELRAFISRFAAYFGADARFDLWVHSPGSSATLVWDRHNLIYGYGPLECYRRALRGIGFAEGIPTIPAAHQHHYREELDADARAVLSAFSWQRSPLRDEDEQ